MVEKVDVEELARRIVVLEEAMMLRPEGGKVRKMVEEVKEWCSMDVSAMLEARGKGWERLERRLDGLERQLNHLPDHRLMETKRHVLDALEALAGYDDACPCRVVVKEVRDHLRKAASA